jgi:hypothetical protein
VRTGPWQIGCCWTCCCVSGTVCCIRADSCTVVALGAGNVVDIAAGGVVKTVTSVDATDWCCIGEVRCSLFGAMIFIFTCFAKGILAAGVLFALFRPCAGDSTIGSSSRMKTSVNFDSSKGLLSKNNFFAWSVSVCVQIRGETKFTRRSWRSTAYGVLKTSCGYLA